MTGVPVVISIQMHHNEERGDNCEGDNRMMTSAAVIITKQCNTMVTNVIDDIVLVVILRSKNTNK